MQITFIILLIILNGLFSMSEMAIVASRKARLQRMINEGRMGAKVALTLRTESARFLSTIQIGITTVAILSGAVGERMFIQPLSEWVSTFPTFAPYSQGIALTIIVVLLSYFSIIFGELVPKRLALRAPEKVASFTARPMMWLTGATKPLVSLLSTSSSLVLNLFRIHREKEPPITDEEIKVLMQQGTEAGVFHKNEQEIVSNVLRLDEQLVGSIMTPRKDVCSIDLEDSEEELCRQIQETPFVRLVVCKDGLKHILGVLQTSELLKKILQKDKITVTISSTLIELLSPPLYVLETMTITQLLEHFRKARTQFALIIDEYGELLGIVTLTDVLTGIVGNLPTENLPDEFEAVMREDGSWLMDGSLNIERFKHLLNIQKLPDEDEGYFHTLAGFVLQRLGRIPNTSDYFECVGWRFEVVDMDKHRVDKVLVSKIKD